MPSQNEVFVLVKADTKPGRIYYSGPHDPFDADDHIRAYLKPGYEVRTISLGEAFDHAEPEKGE